MKLMEEFKPGFKTWYPLFLIIFYIFLVALVANWWSAGITWGGWMQDFMAGFFLVFSGFKFLDLPGFARAYATYDLLAKRYIAYGYIYPFIELLLGLAYVARVAPILTNIVTILVMGFSSVGVINALMKRQNFRCACLGTVLNVPMTAITLLEDVAMVVMALLMLFRF
ncbi:MAG: heavy-metal-associated domain-containing protein [Gammaproteobacteria bacterium]